jgi:trimethylamine--corrinoid protein Co-methyltransferase
MSRGRLEFLTSEEIRRIHDTSLRVLEEVGVNVHSEAVTRLLVDAGASLSDTNGRLLIPNDLVKHALSSAPKSVLLASRDRSRDIRIPANGHMYVSNGGEGVYVKDLLSGETRPTTLEDYRRFAQLVESIPQVDFSWGMVGALDQPAHVKDVIELKTSFEYTTKHFQGGANDAEAAKEMIALASILVGSPEELSRRPIFSSTQCPISPLAFEKGLAEAQVELAKAGVPVVAMVASVAGLTSPVTLSGSIAQINAENLASLVITQASKKGAPWIYSSDSVPGDLSTGSIDYGAMEANLLRTGAGQMGRFYGLPTMVAGIGLEATSLLLGRVRDGLPYMVIQGLVPSDLGSGLGGVDQAAGAAYEQLIVDAWVWDVAREFIREFDADDSAISFETIRDAGLDGNFLGKRHTLTRFRRESVVATKPEGVFHGRGDSGSRGNLVRRAKEEVERMLNESRGPVIDADTSDEMDDFVKGLLKKG